MNSVIEGFAEALNLSGEKTQKEDDELQFIVNLNQSLLSPHTSPTIRLE